MKRRLPARGWRRIASVIAPVCIGVLLAYGWTAAAAHVGPGRIAANISPVHVRIPVVAAADQASAWAVPAVTTEAPLPVGFGRASGSHPPHGAGRHRVRNRLHRRAFTHPERKGGARAGVPGAPDRSPSIRLLLRK